MAFVYRKLTDLEIAYIASFKIRAVLGGGRAFVPRKAAVDEERGIYYFHFDGRGWRNGQDGAPPSWCSLIWNGDVFRITMYEDWSKDENGLRHMVYRVVTIYAPEKYKGREEEITQVVQEAIIEDDRGGNFATVKFLEMARPSFVDYDISQTHSTA